MSIIVALNLCTIAGFGVVSCVLGGSTLSAVSDGSIDDTAGIVVIGVCGMVVSFGGYKFLHQYERYCWLFALVAIVIATGVGGSNLSTQTTTVPPTAATVLSFGGVIAGFLIPWAVRLFILLSRFKVTIIGHGRGLQRLLHPHRVDHPHLRLHLPRALRPNGPAHDPRRSNWRSNPFDPRLVNRLQHLRRRRRPGIDALTRRGVRQIRRGPPLLSLLGNLGASMYSITLNFQLLLPFFMKIPRFVFSVIYTAILIPVSVMAAKSFFTNLENFLYVIAYWSAAFVSVVLVEHFLFRRGNCTSYDASTVNWDSPKYLPTGISAIAAMALSFGLIVPCMGQAWFTGPIAETTGDIGFEIALVLAGLLYAPLRWAERRIRGV